MPARPRARRVPRSSARPAAARPFVPPPPPPEKGDARRRPPDRARLRAAAREASDRGREPDRREALHLRRRPQALPARPARPRLRLLRRGLARAPRRPLPALAAAERRPDELGPPTARATGSRSTPTAATPTWWSPATASTPRCATRTRPAPRPAPAGAERSASRPPSWRATRAATSRRLIDLSSGACEMSAMRTLLKTSGALAAIAALGAAGATAQPTSAPEPAECHHQDRQPVVAHAARQPLGLPGDGLGGRQAARGGHRDPPHEADRERRQGPRGARRGQGGRRARGGHRPTGTPSRRGNIWYLGERHDGVRGRQAGVEGGTSRRAWTAPAPASSCSPGRASEGATGRSSTRAMPRTGARIMSRRERAEVPLGSSGGR